MNTPQHPEDERTGSDPTQGVPRDRDGAVSGNPYANQYQRSEEPNLDANAPRLKSTEMRRMNQRALFFLGGIVLLLVVGALWLFRAGTATTEKPKQRDEKVSISDAPTPLPLPQLPATQVAQPPQDAIPLAPPMPSPPLPTREFSNAPSGPSLLQRRIAASNDGAGGGDAPNVPNAAPVTGMTLPGGVESKPTSAQPLTHPDTLMQRGTYIRCVLETRIISDIPGFSTCLVTEPVYSFNGHTLLLPKGSKLLGSYSGGPTGRRMAVIWDRIITPTGIDVNMSSPGMDNLGGSGLPGYYSAHWAQRISSALLISLLSDAFKYEAAKHGPRTTTIGQGFVTETPFESNTAQTIQSLSDQAVREAANRPPTVTINQGTIIYVYVSKDVDFSGVVARS